MKDHTTPRIPAPHISFRDKEALKRKPRTLKRVILFATSSAAAAVIITIWFITGYTPINIPTPDTLALIDTTHTYIEI